MASPLVRELLDAGIHFGHHTSRWNPKMKPYIYGKRNGIHIVDIRETLRGLLRGQRFISRVVAKGEDVLFVGTKRQARETILQQVERCGMHSVTERWLGGTLTNFRTIRSRLQRLEELEALRESPAWETGYSKKMKSTLTRELRKIQRNLSGIRNMTRLPGALVVIDVRKEANALREARKLGIPSVCVIDTDSDPDTVSIPIPGNDDAMRAIALIVANMADAVEEGKRARPEPIEKPEGVEGGVTPAPARRRARRGAPVGRGPTAGAPQPATPQPAAPPGEPEATAVGVAAPATPAPTDPVQPASQTPAPETPAAPAES